VPCGEGGVLVNAQQASQREDLRPESKDAILNNKQRGKKSLIKNIDFSKDDPARGKLVLAAGRFTSKHETEKNEDD